MYLVAIGWLFVVVCMAGAEAMSPVGSLLGAFFTLLLYGLLPLSAVLYVMGAPARRRALKAVADRGSAQPDGGGHAAGEPVAPEREEP
jgi:membrane protein implicated in regulation of membrane protease activity